MATNFLNLGTKEGMKRMDKLLGEQNFISGEEPCKDDLAVYGALKGVIDSSHVNILRWYNQVNDILGSRFLREGEGVTIGTIRNLPLEHREEEETYVVDITHPFALNEVNKNDLELFQGEANAEGLVASASHDILKNAVMKDPATKRSFIKLEIKPWDDIVDDLSEVETHVRGVEMDGLFWGDSKFVINNFGIKKLQIMMTIEDDKVSPHDLIEKILGDESANNFIQSCDIVAFTKI